MARSRRKTPKIKITGGRVSNKEDRSLANRKFRRRAKVAVKIDQEPPVSLKEVSDPWGFKSDGLARWGASEKELRK